MTDRPFPKLRAIDVRPISQSGRTLLLLRDPLQLSHKVVTIPQQLAPMLALCDGTRDSRALSAALGIRFGLRVGEDTVNKILAAFGEALLLENDRFAQAQVDTLAEYRQAPFRPPALAGQSYPAEVEELRRLLDDYLDAVDVPPGNANDVRGLISPHIDYQRGGPTYAQVWKHAEEAIREADLVIMLGTDHFGPDNVLTLTYQNYSTPFGVLPTSRKIVDVLAQALTSARPLAGELYHRSEHSIELGAIWLHHMRQGQPCELVPILCGSFNSFLQGDSSPGNNPSINTLVNILKPVIAARRTVVVAAADLAHVGPAFGGAPLDFMGRAQLRTADDERIQHIRAGDAEGFYAAIKRVDDRHNVCGLSSIYIALRLLSPVGGEIVAYNHCPADHNGTSVVSICGVLLR